MSTLSETGPVEDRYGPAALRELIDAEQIRRLKYAYCRAADAMDAAGMLAVFTDDCVVDLSGGRGGAVTGVAAARKFYSGALSKFIASSHHLSNMDVVFDSADTARMESYLFSWQRYKEYPELRDRHRWARYRDVYRRTQDGWKQTELVCYVGGEVTPEELERSCETTALPSWR
ncbi:nuclear transport factor 2 family protein [Rhodococcus sp. NPDC127530]|uniref:nuclear transport factor 2 family protein n=1 Tax=unclassified Rhodococcus (in: high G+C Gram-positive bacteria) TaxID=192944 RepID=UPI00362DE324